MKDTMTLQEYLGRENGLRTHLQCNFYPRLPDFVVDAFVEVFKEHWDGKLPVEALNAALAERAYYTGGIEKYDFWQFINEEELH